jgi:hypothetical protein
MLTRDTHARIYQGDLSRSEHDKLQTLARQKNVTVRDLISDAINKSLRDLRSGFSQDIEEVMLHNGRLRFYLWLPYQVCGKIDRMMKNRNTYVQELVRQAIREYNKADPEDIGQNLWRFQTPKRPSTEATKGLSNKAS